MPTESAKAIRQRIPCGILEGLLLQAVEKPEALYQVVGLVWSSLVRAPSSLDEGPPATETLFGAVTPSASSAAFKSREEAGVQPLKLAPGTSSLVPAAQWEGHALSQQHSLSPRGDTPLRCTLTSSGALSVLGEPVTPYLEHTLAGRGTSSGAVVFSDGEDVVNHSAPSYLDTTLNTAIGTGHSMFTTLTASSSVGDSPLTTATQPAPLVQLSPLILRLLLWWAGRPSLPSTRGEATSALQDAWGHSRGSTNNSDDSSGSSSEFVPAQQRRQQEAEEAHQLRRRIADIFTLLCRGGFGVVVSDALVYGRCHDASEAAAARCNLVFSRFAPLAWSMATTTATAAAASVVRRAGEGRLRDPAPLLLSDVVHSPAGESDGGDGGGGAAPSRYKLETLLAALMEVHTPQQGPPSAAAAAAAVSDADVAAAGQLLRCLLRCPRLHSRITRLLDRSDSATTSTPLCGNTHSTTLLLSAPSMSASPLGTSRHALHTTHVRIGGATESAGDLHTHAVRLQAFLPALTHPSPVVSSEAWHTVRELLLPSANMSAATRRLLQRSPECPVQHLLVAVLALPGDGSDSSASVLAHGASHPMARNSALRLLHVLCVSTDVPPSSQRYFTQCAALLWRVLKLAAELCHGNVVASAVLVRRVLADYVVAVMRPSNHAGSDASVSTATQRLLHGSRKALSAFFTATYASCGRGGGAASMLVDTGGDCVEAAMNVVNDEADLQRALRTLETLDAARESE